jgi:hypothetical protein
MTIQTLRPNGDVLTSGTGAWAITGAATRWQAVSDNSDASFVACTVQKGYFRVSLGNMTTPTATQRIRSVTVRQRNGHSAAGGGSQTSHCLVYNDAQPTLPPVGSSYFTRTTTSAVTQTGVTAYTAPGGTAWSSGVVNVIGLQTSAFLATDGSGTFMRVYELYADVDVNEQPTVSGVTVTTFSNNAQPNVAWTYADTDGDPQTAFNVKIFDSATYGSANFDPESSAAAWDSTQITGGDQNATVGASPRSYLQNGVTYKAYVKVAHAWPGPEGALWWSTWVASSSFSVTFTIPYTPTLSASLLQDRHSYQALLTTTAPINLLTADNSSFETTVGTWAADTNMGTPTRSLTNPLDGLADMLLSSTAGGTMIAKCNLVGDTPNVSPGVTYTALASFRAAVSARSVAVGIRWLNVAGGVISTTFGSTATDGTGGYVQASYTVAAPALAATAIVVVEVLSTGGAAEQHRVDQVSLAVGSSTSWTPGGFTGAQDVIIERGEFCDNARGPAVNWAHQQIASGGSLYQNTNGFTPPSTDSVTWEYCDKSISDYTPSGMIRWFTQTASTNNVGIAGSAFSDTTQWRFPVVASSTHTLSLWAWVDSGTFATTPRILWKDSSETTTTTSTGSPVTLTTTPQRITFSVAAPSNAVFAAANITNDNSTTGKAIFFTRVGWGLGSIAVDGFQSRNYNGVQWLMVNNINDAANNATDMAVGSDTGQTILSHDNELPSLRPVLYRARQQTVYSGSTLTSSNSTYVTLYGTELPVTILRSVTQPLLSVAVDRRMAVSYATVEDSVIYHPIGANGAPIKIRDWIGGEDGQLIVITTTEAQVARLRAVVYSSDVMEILWHQGGKSYVLITGWDIAEVMTEKDFCDADGYTNTDLRYDAYSLTFVETAAP